MSTDDYDPSKFRIDVPDDNDPLERDAIVEHAEYGPLRVDSVRVGRDRKTVDFWSELGESREGVQMTADEIREAWGETIHYDPTKVHEQNPHVGFSGITAGHESIEIDIEVRGETGDESDIECVAVHARDEAVRAIQALMNDELPEDCGGSSASVDWPAIVLSETE
jgi:hypothetical protein